jgi:hypothetical protein
LAEIVILISEIGALADQTDRVAAGTPTLADARIQDRPFPTRVRADDQERV